MKLVVMMLKLLHDQGKFISLWKRNMLKFTAIYLCPLLQISPPTVTMTPLHCLPHWSMPGRTSLSCSGPHGTMNVMADAQTGRSDTAAGTVQGAEIFSAIYRSSHLDCSTMSPICMNPIKTS